jgi:hypothetical protein
MLHAEGISDKLDVKFSSLLVLLQIVRHFVLFNFLLFIKIIEYVYVYKCFKFVPIN